MTIVIFDFLRCVGSLSSQASVSDLLKIFGFYAREALMKNHVVQTAEPCSSRRAFLERGSFAAGAAVLGADFLGAPSAFGQEDPEEKSGRLTKGDAALLRFAAAAEILETGFWVQCNDLGGVSNTKEVPGGGGNSAYTKAIQVLDGDMPQYIAKGAEPVSLDRFRTANVPSSMATGSSGKLRLTNLKQLTVDTSWWTRYRFSDRNPDLDPSFVFPQGCSRLEQRATHSNPQN